MRYIAIVLTLLVAATAVEAITINITYDDAMGNPSSSGTFNAGEKGVISQAVSQWQSSITTAGVMNITVLKSNLGGNLLGLASNYTSSLGDSDFDGKLNGVSTGGLIQLDDRTGIGEVPFFVDNTPTDNTEYGAGNTAYHFLAPNASPAKNFYDMLSVAKHEVAHVLGFTQSFDNFFDNLAPSPVVAEGNRWVYVFGGAPSIGPAAQYLPDATQIVGFLNGGVYMREWEESVTGPGPVPSHVDEYTGPPGPAPPATGIGAIAGFFPDDLMNPLTNLGERMIESDVDLDILADAYGYTVIPEPTVLSLLAVGAVTIFRRKRR